MKNLIVFIAAILTAGFSTIAMGQVQLPSNQAGAELVQVLTIERDGTSPLHFGRIGIKAGTAGSVILGTNGSRNATGVTLIATGSTLKSIPKFKLTGTVGAAYTILISSPIVVTTAAAGEGTIKTMDIDALRIKVDNDDEAAYSSVATHTLTDGLSSFLLSGTLNIAATQQIGVYTGSYSVTVDYN